MKKLIMTLFLCLAILISLWVGWSFWPEPISIKYVSFKELPNWTSAATTNSLEAFLRSCRSLSKKNPESDSINNAYFHLKIKDWLPACQAAKSVEINSDIESKKFFETWFTPVEFYQKKNLTGLFTGYYMPVLEGSLTKDSTYTVPIYGVPNNLIVVHLNKFDPQFKNRILIGRLEGNKLVPFYTREEINHGALKNNAPVLLWVKNHIDRLFLEIQGSGVVQLPNGKKVYLGYASENGASYTPIGRILIQKGVMTKENASMQGIKKYFDQHPKDTHTILNQNKSFVFFHFLENNHALGTQGIVLTPGYSLAVDPNWIPIGAPLWLTTTRPAPFNQKKTFNRLMIAQDIGGAIRGIVRGDVYWGEGEKATFIAGHMKEQGHYWLLLPSMQVKH